MLLVPFPTLGLPAKVLDVSFVPPVCTLHSAHLIRRVLYYGAFPGLQSPIPTC